jgi:hypothetical protein
VPADKLCCRCSEDIHAIIDWPDQSDTRSPSFPRSLSST